VRQRQAFVIDDRENGGVCAYAKCQGSYRGDRKAECLGEHADGVFQVLQEYFHGVLCILVAAELVALNGGASPLLCAFLSNLDNLDGKRSVRFGRNRDRG
jgi:hypothetical protein